MWCSEFGSTQLAAKLRFSCSIHHIRGLVVLKNTIVGCWLQLEAAAKGRATSSRGELGDCLGALRHGVLGQLTRQDEAHLQNRT